MEGDLNLAQSFGGLRIANPDDATPPSRKDDVVDSSSPSIPRRTSSASRRTSEQHHKLHLSPSLGRKASNRTPSPLNYHATLNSASSTPSPQSIQEGSSSQGSGSRDRRSMPPNYQAQQQQQFGGHSPRTGGLPSSHGYRSTSSSSSRPASTLYPQSLPTSPPAPNTGEGSRLRDKASWSSITGQRKRSDSRNSPVAMQAGVPTREEGYNDRQYKQGQTQPMSQAPLPARKTSRGLSGNSVGGGTPQEPALSGSPYALEGGPLSSSEEWQDRGAAMGIQRELDRNGRPISKFIKKGVKDFSFGRTLGEGSYSTVIAATDRQTLREYAIKVLDKRHIIKEKKVKYVNIEKDTLNRLTDHPGVVRLYYTFQDERSLYFVLDVASGGELLGVLKKMSTFDEECTRFYGAQILDTVDYMHSRGVIHRDLKPENVLLDDTMHVKITDFGTAKILDPPKPRTHDGMDPTGIPMAGDPLDGIEDSRANSFVGTAEYVSPELLTDKNACKASDLWAFGCIIYQLLAGRPPFKAGNEYQTFQKIVNLDYEFPKGFPLVAKDLVERLLVLDPAKRLSVGHIKNHEFFDGVNWGRGLWSQRAPRLKSYASPQQEANVIKLNGQPNTLQQAQSKSSSSSIPHSNNGAARPQPRVITELPPPSQLDIEWSPVLTRTNERILKLGNLMVHTAPAALSPNSKNGSNGDAAVETPRKFSRFFGGNTIKKRQRLVMVTSTARVILAAAGGDEKKVKTEVPLLAQGCSWRTTEDAKGLTVWCVDTREKQYTFEDPKFSPPNPESMKTSAQEWLDALERAKDMALSHSTSHSYGDNDGLQELPSISRPVSSLGLDPTLDMNDMTNAGGRLVIGQGSIDSESSKGRKRFSKRQSKSGLAAVF
ncbi:MAG: pkb-activating kinase-like protein [Piccolia ochrophora]|nr:MAG: pkb-activating kinase-like protein [Piccolia ochrophora]